MLKLVIADDEGKTTVVPLSRDEITIGRMEGNVVRLTERNVSRQHARLVKTDDFFLVEDLGSFNGVKVNGRRIEASAPLKVGDQISIGDFILSLRTGPEAQPDTGETAIPDEPSTDVDPLGVSQTSPLRLVMIAGPTPGKEFFVTEAGARVGRIEELEIFVDDPSVSREHAEFSKEGATLHVADLGSGTGVRVNGEDVDEVELNAGDIVELGRVQFRVVGQGEDFVFAQEPESDAPDAPRKKVPVRLFAALGAIGAVLMGFLMARSTSQPAAIPPDATPRIEVTRVETRAPPPVLTPEIAIGAATRAPATNPASAPTTAATVVPSPPLAPPEEARPTPARPPAPMNTPSGRRPVAKNVSRVRQASSPTTDSPPTPAAQPSTNSSTPVNRLAEARACVMHADHPCVIRLLGRANGRSDQELQLLIETYRNQSMWREACGPMGEFVRRFADTSRARNYQQLITRYCQ